MGDVWISGKNGTAVISVFIDQTTFEHYGCIFFLDKFAVTISNTTFSVPYTGHQIILRQLVKHQILMMSTRFNPSDHDTRCHLEPSTFQSGAFSVEL
ncbi:hypothetical protein HNY73_002406 [Argiope bruennichi]|uniref:Uncharacterized protein n=1 Tax=Argiope bruennichi TaxID=94029 RepID=A0A8T0FZV7_ARGBR|nr:hypothetical protein HNY73_002406 [Argiope bruennichi]